ncbi:dUTP diphosphatase [Paracoccus litorisediminis]|uniref:Deoxyuridine 5'-triphosphate nucleotidohydrolase n=1 Tax=Paracoccus litorisediminis TaxID=2006130 RepID=A0A844HMH2_9RHOB|nr:dUTP diphosphatase [Paracoccus litorisediminis]MTH61120.1 dUTP diphosphatase [Paracoccus litorisediminis]
MTIVRFKKAEMGARLPRYETPGAAGADVCSVNLATIYPGERKLISTGLACDIPAGYELQVRPRSGLAFKKGVTILNGPGTIDSDYKGVLGVLIINHGDTPFEVNVGDRIAQIVVAPVLQAQFAFTSEVGASERGEGGFGSTGVSSEAA